LVCYFLLLAPSQGAIKSSTDFSSGDSSENYLLSKLSLMTISIVDYLLSKLSLMTISIVGVHFISRLHL
jgi:hypothetical protein